MADCDCMECPRCDGHGWVYVGAPEGDEDGFTPHPDDMDDEECSRCSGTGIDPEYTGCDC